MRLWIPTINLYLRRTNPSDLKLSALFARYLYQHRQLNLPGIGVFTLDPSITIPDSTDKQHSDFVQHIKFQQKPVANADEQFIDFIRTQTGKIRPLAESDLDSFLSDGKILLNIGKPFHLEGIGSLQKTRSGQYDFTPGEPVLGRLESYEQVEQREEQPGRRKVFTDERSPGSQPGKALVGLAMLLGLVLVIWLGYKLYNHNANGTDIAASDTVQTAPADTPKANVILDSVQKIINAPTEGSYKFVIEKTYSKPRALRRFAQIKDNLTNVKMNSNADSTFFTLYFVLPATPSDTSRIRDSLKIWYGRKQVFVEKP